LTRRGVRQRADRIASLVMYRPITNDCRFWNFYQAVQKIVLTVAGNFNIYRMDDVISQL
jgi:hypothetical protein